MEALLCSLKTQRHINKYLQLNTSLQAIAVRTTLHKTVTVCSLYLPPTSKYSSSDFVDFITQLPPPVLILGDFNAYSSLWGCTKTGIRGKLIEDLLLKQNLSLLNDGSHTYLHPCLLYTSPSPRDGLLSRMPSSA